MVTSHTLSLRRFASGTALAAAAFLLLAAAPQASHAQTVLTFEGLQNLEEIGEFYNGGVGSKGSSGTNYGVSFGSSALAVIDSDAGGTGNFANEPTPDTVLFFLDGNPFLNVSAGFTDGFSFYYTAINQPGSIQIYDGLDGTGALLASLELPVTPSTGVGDPNGQFDNWAPIGIAFSGTARSVNFGGTVNQIGFDNVTLGNAIPVAPTAAAPEPGSIALLLTAGVPVVGLIRRRKQG